MKFNQLTKDILLKEGEIAESRLILTGQSETENTAQEKKHELPVAQREELLAQQEIIKNQLDLTFQLGAALIQAFDSSAGRGLEQLLMGTGDSSEIGKKDSRRLTKSNSRRIIRCNHDTNYRWIKRLTWIWRYGRINS